MSLLVFDLSNGAQTHCLTLAMSVFVEKIMWLLLLSVQRMGKSVESGSELSGKP